MTGIVGTWRTTSPLGACRVYVQWIATADGVAEVVFDGSDAPGLPGVLDRIVAAPDPGAPPSADYDAELLDDWDRDLAEAACADLSNTDVEARWPYVAVGTDAARDVVLDGSRLRLRVTNAGDGGAGRLCIVLLPLQEVDGVESWLIRKA